MKKVLFLSVGNRDLQLSRNCNVNAALLMEHFESGNVDTGGSYILKKNDQQFIKHSLAVFNEFDEINTQVTFPMVQHTIEQVGGHIDEIIILTTQQEPLDPQDCHYIALFLKKYLEKNGYNVSYLPIQFPPVDLEKLMDFYNALYGKYAGCEIYFGNSGGTPDMRAATHMAGMFKGITFITIQARTQVTSQKNFYNQERKVLSHIIDNMLKVYDYGGIINLPVSDIMKEKCKYALDLYNLKTDIVDETDNFGDKSKKAIALLIENMKVCFQQGRYADVIGRIFRIEEATGQFLLHKELGELKGLNEKDKVIRIDSKGNKKADKTFEDVLSNQVETIYLQYFPGVFTFYEEKNLWYFVKYPGVKMNVGKNTFFFLFQSLSKYKEFYSFFEKLNDNYSQENRLTKLRNRSYLGHGFKGVSKADIEEITGDFNLFYQDLKQLLEQVLSETIEPLFDKVNKEIKEL
jgi:hypothetical protein